MAANISIDPNALDPNVLQIGLLAGLLEQQNGSLYFVPDWFSDPLDSIKQIGTNGGPQLVALLESLLGSMAGNSLGTPTSTLNHLWYPIQNPEAPADATDKTTGIYVVTSPQSSPPSIGDAQNFILGLGLLRQFKLPAGDFTLTVYAYFPVLQLPPQNGEYFVLGSSSEPIQLGVEVTGPKGALGNDEISFDGLQVASSIFFEQPPQLEIVLLNLLLPGEATPADRSLLDMIENINVAEWIKIGIAALAGQLSKGANSNVGKGSPPTNEIGAMVYDVLALLGLTGVVPPMDWAGLIEGKEDFPQMLEDWFRSIAGSPVTLQAWLNEWYCLRNGIKPLADGSDIPVNVTGTGTRTDPFTIQLFEIANEINIGFTVATVSDASGNISVFPGLVVSSNKVQPVTSLSQLATQFKVAVELVELELKAAGQSPPAPFADRLFPSFDIAAVLLNSTDGQPLFRVADPSSSGTKSLTAENGATPVADAFSIGTIQAGLSYSHINTGSPPVPGPKSPVPSFRLTSVTTALRSWDVIDLLNFNEDVELVEGVVSSLLQNAINKFLPAGAGEVAASLSAVLGITPPTGFNLNSPPDSNTWPVAEMLLSPGSLNALVSNPFGALAAYYTRCLTTLDGSPPQPVWRYLLPDFANLLGGFFGQSATLTGSGTEDEPWQAQLLSLGEGKPAAYVQAWYDPSTSSPPAPAELHLALYFAAPLPINAVTSEIGIVIELLSLSLPNADGSGSFGSEWLQSVAAQLTVAGPLQHNTPSPLATPPLAGMSVQVDDIKVSAGWDRDDGFYWAAGLSDVQVISGNLSPVKLGDLIFSSALSWQSEVNELAQVIVNTVGLGLLEHGGRFGTMLTIALGLLPNLPEIFSASPPASSYPFDVPVGITLPDNWPTLNVNAGTDPFFTNPWPAIRAQLASLLSEGAFAEPLMQLIGWAIDGQVPAAPTLAPAGTATDPWVVTLENAWNLQVLMWGEYEASPPPAGSLPGRLGLGLRKVMTSNAALGVVLDADIRLNVAYVNLGGGTVGHVSLPSASLTCNLSSSTSGVPLVENTLTGLKVESAQFGAAVDLNGFYPVVALTGAQLTSADTPATVELVAAGNSTPIFTCNQTMQGLPGVQVMENLLYAVMQELSNALGAESAKFPALDAMFQTLAILQLVQLTPDTSPPASPPVFSYGINVGAWDSLLANPGAFFTAQMQDVLADPAKYLDLLEHLATLIGNNSSPPSQPFRLPAVLDGLPDLLAALGLLTQTPAGNFSISSTAWLTLVKHPLQFFENRWQQLVSDASARKALLTALSHLSVPKPPVSTAKLSFSVVNGTQLVLSTPVGNPLNIGAEVQFFGDVIFDLQALTMTVDLALSSNAVGSAVAFKYVLTSNLTSEFSFALEAAPAQTPAPFAPLVLYSYPAKTGFDFVQLGEQVPLFVASTFAGKVLNDYVLPSHPLAANLFNVLGLTAQADNDKPPQVGSLLGIFMHPIEWMLSPAVLGDVNNPGALDLDKLGLMLYAIPGPDGVTGPDGISLVREGTDGMMLTGLPYGVDVGLTASKAAGLGFNAGIQPQLSPPVPCVNITAGIAFDGAAGLSVDGDIKLTFDLSSDTTGHDPCALPATAQQLTIDAGYAQSGFSLTLSGYSGSDFTFPILPFKGFNQFFSSGAIEGLLGLVANKMVAAYNAYPSKPQGLVTFVNDVQSVGKFFFPNVASVSDLITELEQMTATPTAALEWLLGWFNSTEQTTATLAQVNNLLTNYFQLKGFEITGSLLQFTPTISGGSSVTPAVTISVGSKTVNGNNVFGMWVDPYVQFGTSPSSQWLFAGGEIGVGVVMPLSPPTDVVLEFMLDATVGADLSSFGIPQMNEGPQLYLSLDVENMEVNGFGLDFFPLGRADASPPATNTLAIELLPDAALLCGGVQTAAVTWLEKFALRFLVPLIADIILDTDAVTNFLDKQLGSPAVTSPGAVLQAWGLLEEKSPPGTPVKYQLGDYSQIWTGKTPLQIVENLVYVSLSQFLKNGNRFKLVPIKDGGIYLVESNTAGANISDFGICVQITDLQINGSQSGSGAGNNSSGNSPVIAVQLGKWQTGDDPWITRAYPQWQAEDPGAYFYLLRVTDNGGTLSYSFNVRLDLISLGVDAEGATNTPLVNIKGFQLGGIEPRIYLSWDESVPKDPSFGLSIRMDDLGIPLGPGFGNPPANANPVAQNLLASSSGGSNGGGSGKDAVNPTFSATASYVQQYVSGAYVEKFDVELYGDDGTPGDPTGQVWLPVQRAFGPLQCRKIGIGWQGSDHTPPNILSLLFDGNVALAGLVVDLIELSIGIPVTDPTDLHDYSLDLQGINISFEGGPVEISGGFLKAVTDGMTEYTGDALIKAPSFTIAGYGSYGVLNNHPSLFLFVSLNAPLGGPAFFFVTGLAGGFGYNRQLLLPTQDTVQDFPLVAWTFNPTPPTDPLEQLNKYVPPQLGEYWLAAGIRFTSFELLDSFALLVVEFGKEFEIALLGLSALQLPKKGDGVNPYVYAELALNVTFKPADGLLAASLVLTSNSFVLDQNCKLTGGFGLYIWFKDNPTTGAHAGEFVVTLGGYNAAFNPPAYYPQEPRLGFNWPISDQMMIKGGAYFALTPSCIMAGGSLEALFQDGNLRAWFTAYADFLISWKPFHYDIDIGVSIGASYTVHFIVTKTFTVELSADVHIWGPRLQGVAHVHWFIISFTVSFGSDGSTGGTTIEWSQFYPYFLPQPNSSSNGGDTTTQALSEQAVKADRLLAGISVDAEQLAATNSTFDPCQPDTSAPAAQSICHIKVTNGLIKQIPDTSASPANGDTIWIINADQFVFTTDTAIPASSINFCSLEASPPVSPIVSDQPLGVYPMGSMTISTPHTVKIEQFDDENNLALINLNEWTFVANTHAVPASLWNTVNTGQESPGADILPDRLVGLSSASPNPAQSPSGSPPIPPPFSIIGELSHLDLPSRYFSLPSASSPSCSTLPGDFSRNAGTVFDLQSQQDSIAVIAETVMSAPIVAYRTDILAAAVVLGNNVPTGGRLDMLAASVSTLFQASPMLGPLVGGAQLPPAASASRASIKAAGPIAVRKKFVRAGARKTRVKALVRQYAHASPSVMGMLSTRRFDAKAAAYVTGRVHTADAFATRLDWQAINGAVRTTLANDDSGGARHEMMMHAGTTLLWDVNDQSDAPATLDFDGELSVRVVAFDRHQRLLVDTVVGVSGAGTFEFSAATAQVALTALNVSEHDDANAQPQLAGWHGASSLIQVNSGNLLGEGVVVRTQSPVRIPRGRRTLDHGLMRGQEMASRNLVEAESGLGRAGWVETVMPAKMVRSLVVMLVPDGGSALTARDAAATIVQLPLAVRGETNEARLEYSTLAAQDNLRATVGTSLLYQLPDASLPAEQEFLPVRVRPGDGWKLDGVVGLPESDATLLRSSWAETRLEARAALTVDTEDRLTRLVLKEA